MSANSVLPPAGGICRAESAEYFAGVGLNELSECHSMLPRPNSRLRSSRAITWLFLSRLEMSFDLHRQSPLRTLRDVARRQLQRSEVARERELLRIVDRLVAEPQHREAVHARRDRRDVGGRERCAQIDAGDVAEEVRMGRRVGGADGKWHGPSLTPAASPRRSGRETLRDFPRGAYTVGHQPPEPEA